MIEVECPECDYTYEVASSLAGQKIKCPKCDTRIRVPGQKEEGYRCPYCKSKKSPVEKRKRTLLSKVIFLVVFLVGSIFMYGFGMGLASSGDPIFTFACLIPALIIFVAGSYIVEYLLRETVQVCPACHMEL